MAKRTGKVKKSKLPAKQREYEVGNKKPPKEYQFPPGQSGNPAGPPKRKTQLRVWFCKYMEMTDAEIKKLKPEKLTQAQQTALKLVENAKDGKYSGSERLARYVIDRDEGKAVLARHRIWTPSAKEPLDLDGTIGEFLRQLHKGYAISEIRYDPYQMHDLSTRLRSDGLPMVEFPQSVPNLTQMGQNLFELIKSKNIVLYPDREMRISVSHAIAVQNPRGWRIAKEKTSYKIDVIVALGMAALAAIENSIERWLIH